MGVQKREKIPEALEPGPAPPVPPKEAITLEIKGQEYPLPHMTLKRYRKILKMMEGAEKDWERLSESENLDQTRDFYYELMKPEIPELKKADLEDMPLYMYGGEFLLKLKIALFRVPLHS